jgi:hypothetical protein
MVKTPFIVIFPIVSQHVPMMFPLKPIANGDVPSF